MNICSLWKLFLFKNVNNLKFNKNRCLVFNYFCSVKFTLEYNMIAESFKNASHFVKLIFVLFAILIGFVIFMVLGLFIAIPAFGVELSTLEAALEPSKTENIGLLKFLQSMYSIGLFTFPPFLVALFFSGKILDYLKLNKRPNIILIILSAIIVVVAFPLINFLIEMNEKVSFPDSLSAFENLMKEFENEAQKTTQAFLSTDSFSVYLVNVLVMAVIPALGEELLFRGVFQRLFHEWSKNIHLAIWVSAFLFSAMHMQFYGLIPRMVLGAFLGYLFYWSGSLWLPIIAHFINNGIAVTMFYIKGEVAEKADTIGTEDGVSTMLFTSIIIVSALIYSFYRVSKEKKIKLAASKTNNESDD